MWSRVRVPSGPQKAFPFNWEGFFVFMENHYVYILQSDVDGTFYKGYTTDYLRRLEHHNLGLSRYTSNKLPWQLVYVAVAENKREALIREKKLKRCNSEYLRWLIDQPSNLLKG
jgi:putative endonuclease